MKKASDEQIKRTFNALEKAMEVGTPFQLGRLCGIGEEIARLHEEELKKLQAQSVG